MPTPRKHKSPAARQAAFRQRRDQARIQELKEKGLPALPAIPTMPGEARWNKMLERAARLLTMVVEERDNYRDDRSEDWRDSERADAFQERTDAIASALEDLEAMPL